MHIRSYLDRTGETYAEFGRRVGLSAATICRFVNGECIPSRTSMAAITTATEGAVTPNDFYGLGTDRTEKDVA